jgi:predicted solute-binding protein
MLIRIGHTPNPDDAFMFWALASSSSDVAITDRFVGTRGRRTASYR